MKDKYNYDVAPAYRAPDPQPVSVHFELKDPKATTVCLAGTFNNWRSEMYRKNSAHTGKPVQDQLQFAFPPCIKPNFKATLDGATKSCFAPFHPPMRSLLPA
jgi:hypothetical protein